MATVTYQRICTFPRITITNDPNYASGFVEYNIDALDFTTPTSYTIKSAICSGKIQGLGVSPQMFRVSSILYGKTFGTFKLTTYQSGALDFSLTNTGDFLNRDTYYDHYTNHYGIRFYLENAPGNSITLSDVKLILVWQRTVNVAQGDVITKAQFDAIGWSATKGSAISHSGFSGVIYATTYNNASNTITGSTVAATAR